MALPDDYIAVLTCLAEALSAYQARTGQFVVVVGGAATAIYTAGRFPSSDFDLVAAYDEVLRDALESAGFRKEDGAGMLRGGYYHPSHPNYGVQQVTGPLFEGRSDPSRCEIFVFAHDAEVMLPAVEDLIADRLGQHAVASPTDTSRLDQARALYALASSIDKDYLVRRTIEDGGDPTLVLQAGGVG